MADSVEPVAPGKVKVRTGEKISRRKQRRRKLIKRWILGIILVLLISAAWLAFSGFMAAKAVKNAQNELSQLQTAMASTSAQAQLANPKIDSLLSQAADSTNKAKSWTSGPVWWTASKLPIAGNSVAAVRASIAGTDTAVSRSLPVIAEAARVASQEKLRTDGTFNTSAITKTQVPLAKAAQEMSAAVAQADEAPVDWVVRPIATAASDANAQLHQLDAQVQGLNTASKILPTLLGGEGKKSYFVAFTNPTEARAGGGFIGAYGVLTADQGKLKLTKVGTNSELKQFSKPIIDLGPEYNSTYGDNAALWQNMNLSPHFPYAAQQFLAGWNKVTGEELDGVLSVDIVTLAYLAEVTGPLELPNGKTLQANQIVDYLANGIYFDYQGRDAERDELQVGIARELVDTLFTGGESPLALARPFARAASEGRVLLYSTNSDIEAAIEKTPISGIIDTNPGPYAYLVVNNYSGNKIDFYLDRALEYAQTACSAAGAQTKITTTLTNDLPTDKNLPPYIAGRSDKDSQDKPVGTTKTSQLVLLPMGSEVQSVTLNGEDTQYTLVSEAGRPGVLVYTELQPREPATLTIELTEPGSQEQPRIPVQPLIREQQTTVSWTPCG